MKICLFIDDMNDGGNKDEIKRIKGLFKDVKPTYKEYAFLDEDMLKSRFDLMVVDYGGISCGIGNSLNESYEREIRSWAEDHPNCLVLFISVMGKSFLCNEIKEDEPNIKVCNWDEIRKYWDVWDVKKCGQ